MESPPPIALQRNDVFTSPQIPEPARVKSVIWTGTHFEIEAVGLTTNQYYERTFTPAEIAVRRITLGADGPRFRLALLAERIRAAAQYDPQFAVGVSQVDPLPHQIDAVYNYMLKSPRIRFLLADDPGAGKTIMAGLLLRELEQRGALERTLVIAPANLTMQWQDELRLKFNRDFAIIKREQLLAQSGSDLWRSHPRAIMSMDFARRPDVRKAFEGATWDLIIVDEAHKMAAYRYGKKVEKTQAYQLGEVLSKRTDHLLLMTATPHRGNPENFRLLLALLDADLFEQPEQFEQILRQRQMPIFLRRLKEQLKDFDGRPLFPPRAVETLTYELTGSEKDLYEAVTDYVSNRFQRAARLTSERARRNVGLALLVLQRRMASSLRAIRTSLERREARLRQQLAEIQANPALLTGASPHPLWEQHDYIDEADEQWDDDEARWELEEDLLAEAFFVKSIGELEQEIAEVQALRELATEAENEAVANGRERKLEQLYRALHKPLVAGNNLWEMNEKLLVFTENKDTLTYLVEQFRAWGFTVTQIAGGMTQEERRAAQAEFKRPDGAQILVATDAAGEGINLQFCRLMVNYDIPWNPNRLEQRMGRIHRYGQRFSVKIFNLVAENTREGSVLATLLTKLDQMRDDLGNDLVYDIIGDLLSSSELADLLQQAVVNRQSLDEIRASITGLVDTNEQRRRIETALTDALATDALNTETLAALRERDRIAREQRLVPEYIQDFVVQAFNTLAADFGYAPRIHPRNDAPEVWRIESVPAPFRQAAPPGYTLEASYPRLVFKRELREQYPTAEFVAPGHPLFGALLQLVRERYGPLLTQGACLHVSPHEQGLFWLFEVQVKDGTGAVAGQQLVGIHHAPDGTATATDPLRLLDGATLPTAPDPAVIQHYQQQAANQQPVVEWCRNEVLNPFLEELRQQREHEASVRDTWIQRSLDYLIEQQDEKIIEHGTQHPINDQYTIGLRTLQEKLDEYKARREQRLAESARLRALGSDTPRLVGVCALLPFPPPDPPDTADDGNDPDVEQVAIRVATHYEQQHGRSPISVERDQLGFDLRSTSPTETRYIEVKGRRARGDVLLTYNEMIKAMRFGNSYWLYVVYDCASDQPELIPIQNPAQQVVLHASQQHTMRFRVPMADVTRHAAPDAPHA